MNKIFTEGTILEASINKFDFIRSSVINLNRPIHKLWVLLYTYFQLKGNITRMGQWNFKNAHSES